MTVITNPTALTDSIRGAGEDSAGNRAVVKGWTSSSGASLAQWTIHSKAGGTTLPWALSFDTLGDLYVAATVNDVDASYQAIQKYNASGGYIGEIGDLRTRGLSVGVGETAMGLRVDGSNNVWLMALLADESTMKLFQFNTSGTLIASWTVSGASDDLDHTAVPRIDIANDGMVYYTMPGRLYAFNPTTGTRMLAPIPTGSCHSFTLLLGDQGGVAVSSFTAGVWQVLLFNQGGALMGTIYPISAPGFGGGSIRVAALGETSDKLWCQHSYQTGPSTSASELRKYSLNATPITDVMTINAVASSYVELFGFATRAGHVGRGFAEWAPIPAGRPGGLAVPPTVTAPVVGAAFTRQTPPTNLYMGLGAPDGRVYRGGQPYGLESTMAARFAPGGFKNGSMAIGELTTVDPVVVNDVAPRFASLPADVALGASLGPVMTLALGRSARSDLIWLVIAKVATSNLPVPIPSLGLIPIQRTVKLSVALPATYSLGPTISNGVLSDILGSSSPIMAAILVVVPKNAVSDPVVTLQASAEAAPVGAGPIRALATLSTIYALVIPAIAG